MTASNQNTMSANLTINDTTSAINAALSAFLAPKATNQALATGSDAKALRKPASASKRESGTQVKVRRNAPVSDFARRVQTALAEQVTQTERLSAMPASEAKLINVTHSHYCKHCNRSYTCKSNPCLIGSYDISKLHKCIEAMEYRKRMAIMLSYEPICKHNCKRLCNHPKLESDNSNQVNVTYTSRYSIDGLTNLKDTISCQRIWHKAKLNTIADKFSDTPWIANIAKEFRSK